METESNGLMTYDRKVNKIAAQRVANVNALLFQPMPQFQTLIPNAMKDPVTWKFTTNMPNVGWEKADFDDSNWSLGEAGFGSRVPNAKPRTPWNTPEIWLRRTFVWNGPMPKELAISLYHDEDCEVYLNGILIFSATGYVTNYITTDAVSNAEKALKPGKNVLAVHGKQSVGGQFIDVGLDEKK